MQASWLQRPASRGPAGPQACFISWKPPGWTFGRPPATGPSSLPSPQQSVTPMAPLLWAEPVHSRQGPGQHPDPLAGASAGYPEAPPYIQVSRGPPGSKLPCRPPTSPHLELGSPEGLLYPSSHRAQKSLECQCWTQTTQGTLLPMSPAPRYPRRLGSVTRRSLSLEAPGPEVGH